MGSTTSTISTNNPEGIWAIYQSIESVVNKKNHSQIDIVQLGMITQAIQRLAESILIQQKLDPETHIIPKKWNLQIQIPNKTLSTLEDMILANVDQWEPAIPSVQVGHDAYTEGRTAAYRPQLSVNEALIQVFKLSFYDIQAIVNTTPEEMNQKFNRLKAIVSTQVTRLEANSCKEKVKQIANSLNFLQAALSRKYGLQLESPDTIGLSINNVDAIEIYSFDTMLDAKIGAWSLRQSLNLSTFWGSTGEVIWGKADALTYVENEISLL